MRRKKRAWKGRREWMEVKRGKRDRYKAKWLWRVLWRPYKPQKDSIKLS